MKRNNFKVVNKRSNALYSFIRERAAKRRGLPLIFSIFIIALLSSCSDSGSVGGGIIGPGTDIDVDTLEITDIRTDTLVSFSGNLNFFSAGKFRDPLFGNLSATGLIKPLLANNADTLAIDENTNITLNLVLNANTVYGDTSAGQRFDLFEITELWRGNAWRLNDEIQSSAAPVASFSIANKDTIKVPLPDEWVQKYAEYFNSFDDNRDSTYFREFYGLKLVPQNNGKIVTVNPFASSFIATNLNVVPDSTVSDTVRLDSLNIGFREWAYSLDRSNVSPQPVSSTKLISTLEKVIRFNFDFSFNNLGTRNISRVELIVFRDNLLLNESISQAAPAAVRPDQETLHLYYIAGDELPQRISGGASIARAAYDSEDEAYHFDLTAFVTSGGFERFPEDFIFYITLGESEGVIRSTVLYNGQAAGKAPKVIITSVETEQD